MKHPWVTVIVLNYNGLYDTRACIDSLLKTTYKNLHIVVVDNGSRMNESRMLNREFKNRRLKIIRYEKNLGFSGGNNKVMREATDSYVALVNNDVVVRPGWLTPLVNAMKNDARVAVVQPKILWARDRRYFDYAGAAGGYIDFLGYPFTRGRIFTSLEADHGQYDKSTDIFWASGATMMIRRHILDRIGFFDETFFNYMEEIDLCYRVLQAGYRVKYEPQSVVYHKVASTASRNSYKKRMYEHRNNLLLVVKNFPLTKLIVVLPIRLAMEGLSMMYYIASGQLEFALAVIGSFLSFIFLSPSYFLKRNNRLCQDTPPMKQLLYPQSIVFVYFARKKRTFREIVKLAHWHP